MANNLPSVEGILNKNLIYGEDTYLSCREDVYKAMQEYASLLVAEVKGERDAFEYNANQYNEQIAELQSQLAQRDKEIEILTAAVKNLAEVAAGHRDNENKQRLKVVMSN